MRQGLESYRNGQKKNWRGWQWNRIVERLAVPVEEALCLYLCGPEDLDREKALSKGFRSENLIAVDLEQVNIDHVRDSGGLGICHDLGALIREWPADWPLDVIVADYCVGLERVAICLGLDLLRSRAVSATRPTLTVDLREGFGYRDWEHLVHEPTVLALNLQRGRDEFSNGIRRRLGGEKHRGVAWSKGFKLGLLRGTTGVSVSEAEKLTAECCEAINSYRSKRVYMDSLVMRVPGIRETWNIQHRPEDRTARRKITACRAVRTTRLRATEWSTA